MARVVYGQGVAAFKGRIGGTIFSQNPSGSYARNVSSKPYGSTTKRIGNTPDLGYYTQKWFFLDPEQRLAWIAFAAAHTYSDSWGKVTNPTGLAIFISVNFNRNVCGQTFLYYPPTYYAPTPMEAIWLEDQNPEWNVGCPTPSQDTNLYTAFNFTSPMSIGSLYIKNRIRKISVLQCPVTFPKDFAPALTSYFGFSFPFPAVTNGFALGIHCYHIDKRTGLVGLGFEFISPGEH
jgi:hypothetical protein